MNENNNDFGIKQYILFKLDRTIAVLGLICVAVVILVSINLFCESISEPAAKIITGATTALALYVGVRGK